MFEFLLKIYDALYPIIFSVILTGVLVFLSRLAVFLLDHIPEVLEERRYVRNRTKKLCEDYIRQANIMKGKAKRQAIKEYKSIKRDNVSYLKVNNR